MSDRDDLCGRRVGEFVLRERIGEGGFGAVYRCEQPLLGREAVVKVLNRRMGYSDSVVQRFMREAQLASRLDHPYAAHIYAFGVEAGDGLCWIAMEMVHGVTLARWLADRGPLAIEQMVPFFERVAEVVQTAHERGIIHRDLKPQNIMVIERAGQLLPKLLDFGIAKLVDETEPARDATVLTASPNAARDATLGDATAPVEVGTQRELMLGSPGYMAPEQWIESARVGARADIYALGIVAYEMLTGRRPFHAESAAAMWDLHCHAPVPPLGDGFEEALDDVFEYALAKRPEDRPATALELAGTLRVAVGIANDSDDVPRLDEGVRDAWLVQAPQPLAEAVAVLDAARNVHQARDAARDLFRGFVRYLLAIAIASRAQVREGRGSPRLDELLRALKHRELDDAERVQLLALLVEPFVSCRGAHPMPPLVDLVGAPDAPAREELAALVELDVTGDRSATEELVRSKLAFALPRLARVLRRAAFVLDYALVVPQRGSAERWTGLRRQRRPLAHVRTGTLTDGRAWLLDSDGRAAISLWPLVQAMPPTAGADVELFVFEGQGRHGARLTAAPAGFEQHDPVVWSWLAEHVIGGASTEDGQRDDDRPPYLGLAPFSIEDADRFVGREREIDELANRLRRQPLQLVVGPSGAGKSSFVHAGVVPALPDGWRAITMRPGLTPLVTLEARLAAAGGSDGSIVIVIDQLEEVFTLCRDPVERERFAAALAALAATPEAPTRVIATVRDDFLMQVEALAPLRAAISPGLFLLGNPSRDDLERTIVEPARRAGYELSDAELARDMVEAVAERPGALALLSFTAARLWELRDRQFRQLTRGAYDALGGVVGALRQHAETTFTALPGDEQRLAQSIFRHLITSEQTRAVLGLDELRQRLASDRANAVIDKLVAARLLSTADVDGEMRIEIVHEALLVAWPRLAAWCREDADGKRLREQLRSAAKQWHERRRANGLLWRDEALTELTRWRARHTEALTHVEDAFVTASLADARRSRRNRSVLVGGAFVSLIAVAAGLLVFSARIARQRAQLRDNVQRQYEDRGRQLVLAGDPLQALAYLGQAAAFGARGSSHDFLVAQALHATSGALREVQHESEVRTAVLSHDGTRLLSASADRTAIVWDANTGHRLVTLRHAGAVLGAEFAPNDATIVTASLDHSAVLWDAKTGEIIHRLPHKYAVRCARFSPDGALVLTTGDDDAVVVWDAASGQERFRVRGAGRTPLTCAFSADGSLVASGDRQGTTRLWDARTGALVRELATGPATISVAFAPSGSRLVVATTDGQTTSWDSATGQRLQQLGTQASLGALPQFSPDASSILVTSEADHTAVIWDATTGDKLKVLAGHTAGIKAMTYSPDGRYVVTGSDDATARLWDVRTGRELARWSGHRGAVMAVGFAPQGDRVVTGGIDGRVMLWRAEPQQRVVELAGHTGYVYEAMFTPDGRTLITASGDGTARLWDAASGAALRTLDMHAKVTAAAISPDGKQLAFGTENGAIVLRDAATGVEQRRWQGGAREVSQLSWSRNGLMIVMANIDGSARCWDVSSGQLRFAMRPHDGHQVVSASFDPSGTKIITSAQDSHVRVWDLHGKLLTTYVSVGPMLNATFDWTGHRILGDVQQAATIWNANTSLRETEIVGHFGLVWTVAWSPDGGRVITTAADGTARIWDALTGDEIARFATPGQARTARFGPDGNRIVIGNYDGSVAIYDLPHEHLTLAELRRVLRCRIPFEIRHDRLEPRNRDACN